MNAAIRHASRRAVRRRYPNQCHLLSRIQRCRWSSSLTTTPPEESNLPSKVIDFSISAKIEGEESQVAIVELQQGETLRAESGAMLFMTHGVEMNTDLQGVSSAFSRMMTGQNVFLTDFTYNGGDGKVGTVGLGTDFPSKILRLSLEDYDRSTLICQRGAYMASNPSVDISMEATKSLSAGFFGGQGFILQRLSGQGDVLVKAGGTLVEKELQEGESLRVTSGSIVAFTGNVDYDIQMMPGIKNAMFGGEGLFVTKLTGIGPGAKVWLQGMPADRMISEIARRVPSGGPGIGIPIGMGGGGGDAADGSEGGAAEEGIDGDSSSGEEMVAATDQAIEADRQATVASSGMAGDSSADPDSPSALFGDAAPEGANSGIAAASSDDSFGSSSNDNGMFQNETTFSDDESTSFSEEPFSSDETTFSDDTTDFQSDQPESSFWGTSGGDDQTTTDVFDAGTEGAEEASDAAGGILSTLWDIFTGDD